MKPFLIRALTILGLSLLLGGCASTEATVEGGRNLKGVQRFFVLSNPNDNRALDHQIAQALRARGRTAEVGPMTMMPDDAQAVVYFQDHWTWDFGEHLVFLKINVRDVSASQAYASATFTSKVSLREKPAETVNRLVDALFAK